ncbi:STY4851/ECs_5259 family protein [Alloalcanivorax xenomutans]|uniref:STY4851/ECs_5259 family protein n=1 Tax=Alloalcanivorax xenomutans TaxID=1094342 RepID=UPI001F1FE77C|nr:STY4851/ECs_5259 family protein [Alloalcanivorax xenomutans]MCE7523010.1 STY4851/ECs_5259 family protein [Alloalcanivorax xenomutans]
MAAGGNFKRFQEWRASLLESKGLVHPDGRALYLYRLSEDQFSDLERMLNQTIQLFAEEYGLAKIARLSGFTSLFVLYASEWWRRRYDGSGFSWGPILHDLGASTDSWTPVERSEFIRDGLKGWAIEPRKAGALRFLGTVAVQGGLPLKLLASAQGGVGRLLSRVLRIASRGPFSEEDLSRWVEGLKELLPKSYRRDEIYTLLTDVAWTTLQLKQKAQLESSVNAIAVLDQRVPEWREQFPLSVDDQHAQGLIEQLIRDVADTRVVRLERALPLERFLVPLDDGSFELEARVDVPEHLSEKCLAALFGIEISDLPRTADLTLRVEGVQYFTGVRKLAGSQNYRLNSGEWVTQGRNAIAEHQVQLISADGRVWSSVLPFGEELDDELPWVLSRRDSEPRLVSQGSTSVPDACAMVALPPEWRWCSYQNPLAPLNKQVRKFEFFLYEVEGEAAANGPDGARFKVKTGQAGSAKAEYRWDGDRMWLDFISPRQAFRGVPKLFSLEESGIGKRVVGEPAFKKAGCTVSGNAVGRLLAQYPQAGDILLRSRILVLGRDAKLNLSPQTPVSGTIELDGWGADHLRVVTGGVIQDSSKLGDKVFLQVSVGAGKIAPDKLELEVFWSGDSTPARLLVPFPGKGIRAFDNQGRELQDNSVISVKQVIGARLAIVGAESASGYTLELGSTGARSYRRYHLRAHKESQGVQLRLHDYLDDIQEILASSDSVDAAVNLEIRRLGRTEFQIKIMRYVASLEHAGFRVNLAGLEDGFSMDLDFKKVDLVAFRLDRPEDEPEILTHLDSEGVHTGAWQFIDLQRDAGTWLIAPSVECPYPIRATAWHVAGDMLNVEGLRYAVSIADPLARMDAYLKVLPNMAHDFDHDDWSFVEGLYKHTEHLPLSTLDIWRAFARDEGSMAALAFRMGTIPREACSRFIRELPFAWEAVSFSAWRKAAGYLKEQCSRLSESAASTIFPIHLKDRLQVIKALSPASAYLLGVATSDFFPESQAELRVLKLVVGHAAENQLFNGAECELQRLRRYHAEDEWPRDSSLVIEKIEIDKIFEKYLHRFEPGYQSAVANLPLILAAQVASNDTSFWYQGADRMSALKACAAFAPEWFEQASNLTIARCLADGILD